jgi:FKBP-type peptidyl-prolyl cis-trans isomerase
MMMRCSLFLVLLNLAVVCAFVAQRNLNSAGKVLFLSENEDDPFASYVPGVSKDLAFRDLVVGEGEASQIGDVLTVAYVGKLMKTGKKFDEGSGFRFKLGEGRVLKGWETGLQVCFV